MQPSSAVQLLRRCSQRQQLRRAGNPRCAGFFGRAAAPGSCVPYSVCATGLAPLSHPTGNSCAAATGAALSALSARPHGFAAVRSLSAAARSDGSSDGSSHGRRGQLKVTDVVKSLSASEAEIRKVLDGATEFRILYASNDLPNASASEAERSATIGADGSATGEGTSPAAGQVKWDWKVMERDKALVWAQKEGLHLVLVNATTSPPVFKLQDFEDVLAEQRQKKKDRKVATKELITSKAKAKSSQTVKEMYLSAGIDKHDFYTKMNKVKDFLSDGHSVRMAVVAKGKQRVNSGEGTHGLIRAVQEMVIQALEFVQQIHFPLESNTKGVSVLHKTVQIKSSDDQETPRVNPLRKEFTLVPKSK